MGRNDHAWFWYWHRRSRTLWVHDTQPWWIISTAVARNRIVFEIFSSIFITMASSSSDCARDCTGTWQSLLLSLSSVIIRCKKTELWRQTWKRVPYVDFRGAVLLYDRWKCSHYVTSMLNVHIPRYFRIEGWVWAVVERVARLVEEWFRRSYPLWTCRRCVRTTCI